MFLEVGVNNLRIYLIANSMLQLVDIWQTIMLSRWNPFQLFVFQWFHFWQILDHFVLVVVIQESNWYANLHCIQIYFNQLNNFIFKLLRQSRVILMFVYWSCFVSTDRWYPSLNLSNLSTIVKIVIIITTQLDQSWYYSWVLRYLNVIWNIKNDTKSISLRNHENVPF